MCVPKTYKIKYIFFKSQTHRISIEVTSSYRFPLQNPAFFPKKYHEFNDLKSRLLQVLSLPSICKQYSNSLLGSGKTSKNFPPRGNVARNNAIPYCKSNTTSSLGKDTNKMCRHAFEKAHFAG
uniref:PX domain-containing protein n=1 Tax=Opuntia streptacantha TaxID=393608 RepID=A0A7C9DHH0_OPUST